MGPTTLEKIGAVVVLLAAIIAVGIAFDVLGWIMDRVPTIEWIVKWIVGSWIIVSFTAVMCLFAYLIGLVIWRVFVPA